MPRNFDAQTATEYDNPEHPDRTTRVTVRCPFCRASTVVWVRPADYAAYRTGAGHVQDLFPYLDASGREAMISGVCDDCYP